MGFTSNIAAINAANRALKAAGFPSDAAALKAARAKHFNIEKVEGEWHALIIEPLPEASAQAAAIAEESEQAQAEPSQAAAPEAAQAQAEPAAGQAAFASAAAFFSSRVPQNAPVAIPEARAEFDALSDAIKGASDDEFAEMAKRADEQATAQQATSELKNGKVWIHASSCESPVKRVWAIADAMNAQAREAGKPMPSRKEVQDECVRQGVASGTARTQYQAWKKANDNDAANAENAKRLSDALNARAKQ